MEQIGFILPPTGDKEERWKNIPDWPDYYISNQGRVYSTHSGKILVQSVSKDGYYVVGLCRKGKQRTFKVHRLIAEAFIPNPAGRPCINHRDGVKLNNSLDNLEWVTYSENNQHALRTGLKVGKPGMTPAVKDEIRRLWAAGGHSKTELARKFGVGLGTITKYVKGIESPAERYMSEEVREKVIALWKTGKYSQEEIGKRFGFSQGGVYAVVKNIESPRHQGPRPRIKEEVKEKIARLVATGEYSQRQVAKMCNVSQGAVYSIAKDVEGSKHRTYHSRIGEDTKNEIARLVETGKYSQKQISEIVGVSQSTVSKYIRKAKSAGQ